jgi:apolipoprotein D and lipocalin family protein
VFIVMARAAFATLGLVALTLGAACSQQPLPVATDVDLARFQGQWFEIAKLPRATQLDCVGTTAFYQLQSDGHMVVTNQCRVGDFSGITRKISASAIVPDPAVPAKLSVDFGGFYGDYWILEVDSNYSYAVVGHPTRQYLWILSRTNTMDAATLTTLLDHATKNGFDVSRLEYTAQSPSQ